MSQFYGYLWGEKKSVTRRGHKSITARLHSLKGGEGQFSLISTLAEDEDAFIINVPDGHLFSLNGKCYRMRLGRLVPDKKVR